MTGIEQGIYGIIESQTAKGEWVSVKELADKFKVNKRTIRKAIQNIRENENVEKIILTSYSKGYKLMSKVEEYYYLLNEKTKILKQLKRFWKNVDRFNRNNQMKLTFDEKEAKILNAMYEEK